MLPADYSNPTLILSNSRFIGSKAIGFLDPEQAVTNKFFPGRGGGIGIFMEESLHDVWIVISDCLFEGNTARLFGGGLYFLTISHTAVQHQVWIQRCQFIRNMATSGGGGVLVVILGQSGENSRSSFVFTDCLFERNRGTAGGGIYTYFSEFIILCGCLLQPYYAVVHQTALFNIMMILLHVNVIISINLAGHFY